MKKRLISVISLILAFLTVAACTPQIPPEVTTGEPVISVLPESTAEITEAPPVIPEGIILAGLDFETKAAITCPAGSASLLKTAQELAEYINSVLPDAALTASYDNAAAESEYKVHIAAPDSALNGEYSLVLEGKTLTVKGKTEDGIAEAVRYLKATAVKGGYFFIPEELSFTSGAGPALLSHSPENLYYYEDVYTPELIFEFDGSKVAKEKSCLVIEGVDLSDKATWSDGKLTLTGVTFEPGDYSVFLNLADGNGNVEAVETTFSCGDGSVLNLYCGEVHAHTSDSDGKMSVEDAYKYARDIAKLDFFAVTDHSDSFKDSVFKNKHLTNADAFNDPGSFAALYGYEQTYNHKTGFFGHLNTINYGTLTSRSLKLEEYYKTMAADPNAVVMFNHPGYKWGNFLEYGLFSEEYDDVIDLAEIKGKGYDTEYALALSKGWHISPIYNEDNHEANWGGAYEYCGYALAPSLTRQNIIDAFKKNRTYTTQDKTLKVYYKINDEWMGSRLQAPDKLKVSVDITTEKSVGIGMVYLVAEDNIVVATKPVGSAKELKWEFELDPLYDYYYIKVVSTDNKYWCVTAPIWIEEREQLEMSKMTQSLIVDNNSTDDHRISVELTNNTSEPMTGLKVNFYRSTRSGFNSEHIRPYKTVTVGELKPGETKTVYADIKYTSNAPAVYALASAKQNGKVYGATRYLEISNLYFSEVLPLSTQKSVGAFRYIELYNNSDAVIDLSRYVLRYYPKAGASADDLKANQWELSGKIQPHSTLVLWIVKSSNKYTVAQFNEVYSSDLVEGKNIVRIVGKELPPTGPVQLEILSGSTVVARCWYNWGTKHDLFQNKSIVYTYSEDFTFTGKDPKSKQNPTPGKLTDGQMPEVIKE